MSLHLHTFDLAVVGLYLVAITLFGLRFSRRTGEGARDRSLRGYFLADKTIPWWAIALSIVSAETSTLTIIGTPGLAFGGDFGFLQIVLGYMSGRVVVAALFLPKYFQGEMMTPYQLIDRRFGHALYKVTAGLFLLTRAAAEGVRVFAVSIVVGIAIGTGDVLSIAIISALTLLYTFEGGMAAVIWTDVVQMAIYVGGTLVAIWSLGAHVPGGWATIHTVGAAAGKFHMLNFAMNLTTTYTFWAGVLGGTFLTMASHGTDQLMVQRMLAARNLSESRLALLSSGVVIFIQFALFLLIGVGLFVFYGMHPAELAALHGANTNRIFPAFIVHQMPTGVAGLLIAAILAAAMSNLSAALNSLSSTTVVDFYMGWRPAAAANNPSAERERMIVSRASTVLWAVVLFAVAVYAVQAGGKGNVVEIGLSIASVAYGCLLGVFLLGTLTKYATQRGAIVGMITGFALNVALWQWPGKILLSGGALIPNIVKSDGTIQVAPKVIPTIIIPHIAWTWYVLIGALVTFAVGSLASLIFRKQSAHRIAVPLLLLFCLSFPKGICFTAQAQTLAVPPTHPSALNPAPDFSGVSSAINAAIAAHKLPGAVVVIGHGGKVVFEQAYGVRKLAGEPGLDGKPSAAEPMTTDTIFDMASLTKVLVTATAVMQLYEAGKVDVDAPVAKYLPEFAANGKQAVTVRDLLTHYSGLPPDVSLKDAWGLAAPDKAEGIRRAMNSSLTTTPGTHFEYSDINYIVLGALVEKISGDAEDFYALGHIFLPLGMRNTHYLPFAEACGPHATFGAAIAPSFSPDIKYGVGCTDLAWNTLLMYSIAPTAHDNEGTAETNPDFDHLLRGTVHDPTVRRMGGVAGQAGVFSTAADTALFAQALLNRLAGRPSNFPLKRETLELMTTPQQPSTAQSGATIFTQDGKLTNGVAQRGFGWDINSAFSRPRGSVFYLGSFGHTGFTGTSLWMDPTSDTYVILLSNAIHPRGNSPISTLRGEVATEAAKALGIRSAASSSDTPPSNLVILTLNEVKGKNPRILPVAPQTSSTPPHTLTGIDVLEATGFAALKEAAARHDGHLRIGLLTNQTGLDAQGRRTIDLLRGVGDGVELTALFSPEHGIFGAKDSTNIGQEVDAASGLKVISLYGAKDDDRRPKPEDLKNLDAVIVDLQDAGVRFYTYETVLGYFLEASACQGFSYGNNIEVIVLDRPNLIGGEAVQGAVSNTPASYINYMPLPLRHGMTLGELAKFELRPVSCLATEATSGALRGGAADMFAHLTVVPMQNWHREEFFDQTGVKWVNPSPNLRSTTEATLYPALGMMDFTNVSVGRGTATPFEVFGAGVARSTASDAKPSVWFDGKAVAEYLTARRIPGVTFAATTFAVAEDANRYPYHGQTIEGVRLTVTDRAALDSPELGIEILSALHHLYPTQFKLDKAAPLVANAETMAALARGDDPRAIAASWASALEKFKASRAQFLLYH